MQATNSWPRQKAELNECVFLSTRSIRHIYAELIFSIAKIVSKCVYRGVLVGGGGVSSLVFNTLGFILQKSHSYIYDYVC